MKAMLSRFPGGPETLELTEMATPAPGSGQVLIQIHAAGVNFPDTLIIRDLYQFKPPRPFAPGGEVAGKVAAVGDGVTGLAPGDRVVALVRHGGFATHVAVPASAVFPLPDAIPFEDAACLVFTYGTSYHALKDRAGIRRGETLFVLGAAGGVGSAAVELGKTAGARVIAGVSSGKKADFARSLGADDVLIYPSEVDIDAQKAFSRNLKDLAGPGGLDVVYDAVGGNYSEPAIRALAWEGRFLVVGFPAGIPRIPLNLALLKGCQIVGVFWGESTVRDPSGHRDNVAKLFEMYLDGRIRPRIEARYPLACASEALTKIVSRRLLGKAVLLIDWQSDTH